MRDRHPYKLYGAALLAVVAGLVTLSVLLFNQAFTPATYVTVHVERAGLQLLPGSDVKVRGIIVGSVASISSDGHGATIRLRLSPDRARSLPSNVAVRLLPKTLFGEKYVDLLLPRRAATTTLAETRTVPEDRTAPTLEIDQALDDLLPLLRAVPPVELNHTLTAVGTALAGRGAELGSTITALDRYLRGFNPSLPRLAHDVRSLAGFTTTYTEAAGPLLRMLGNLAVTSTTVVDEQRQISAFLGDVTTAADETRDLLARNRDNLIAVNAVSRPVLSLLSRYSPEFPCFFRGYAKLVPRIHAAVPKTPGLNHAAHVVVEFVPAYPTYQNPVDLPEFSDTRGPSCYGLPNPPSALPVVHYKDGTQDDPRFATQGTIGGPLPTTGGLVGATQPDPTAQMNAVLGAVLGMNASAVPDIADLLWGPLARGSTVRLS